MVLAQMVTGMTYHVNILTNISVADMSARPHSQLTVLILTKLALTQ